MTQRLEEQCGAVETENDDLKTQVAAAQQQLTAERNKHSRQQKANKDTITSLKKSIQQLQSLRDVLQRTVASAREKYQQELEVKGAALQDLEDANRLSAQISHDLNMSKQVNEDLKIALKQAEETAKEKALEVEASTQVAMEAQNQHIDKLEAQLKERDRMSNEHAEFYEKYKSYLRNADFYVSVYETAMRAAFHSFDPVDGQPYFRMILQRVYERKLSHFYAAVKSNGTSAGSADDVAGVGSGSRKQSTLQADCDGESSDDDEPILTKFRRKRLAEDGDADLDKKRVCLGENVNDGDKEDGEEGGDAAVEDYSAIFAEDEDEESKDARSDDGEGEEWLPSNQ